jgi:protein gp37
MAANPNFPPDVRAAYAGKGPPVLIQKRLEEPLHRRKPTRIGVQFMGDWLHLNVSAQFRREMWDVMESTPQHTYLTLTKRTEGLLSVLDELAVSHGVLPNVWIGASIENQDRANERIPLLLQCPAAVRYVSIEPMLGLVYLAEAIYGRFAHWTDPAEMLKLHWAIVGPETGPGARDMAPNWARRVRDDCVAAGVPFFYKHGLLDGKEWRQWPQ